jgi:hypothetical protein
MSERCGDPEHGPTCEGGSLHIARRDAKGCAQLQDGSWITKMAFVCPGPHPEPEHPSWSEAELFRAMLDRLAVERLGEALG